MDVEGGEQMPTLNTASGSVIPGFAIQALDQWENPTQPCPEMPFDLSIVSDKLEPEESTIHFDPIATVKGKHLQLDTTAIHDHFNTMCLTHYVPKGMPCEHTAWPIALIPRRLINRLKWHVGPLKFLQPQNLFEGNCCYRFEGWACCKGWWESRADGVPLGVSWRLRGSLQRSTWWCWSAKTRFENFPGTQHCTSCLVSALEFPRHAYWGRSGLEGMNVDSTWGLESSLGLDSCRLCYSLARSSRCHKNCTPTSAQRTQKTDVVKDTFLAQYITQSHCNQPTDCKASM